MSNEINNNNEEFIELLKKNGFAESLLNNNVTVSMCLSALFKLKKQLMDEIEELKNSIGKTPHRCPICNGSGKNNETNCNGCGGKSIVWG